MKWELKSSIIKNTEETMIEIRAEFKFYLKRFLMICYSSEGEEEAEWLRAAGLGELTEAWKAGLEVQPEELGAALRPLSRAQAEAVKRRVRSLNHTVKQRFNQRQRARKPDIRNVFKDAEVSHTNRLDRLFRVLLYSLTSFFHRPWLCLCPGMLPASSPNYSFRGKLIYRFVSVLSFSFSALVSPF